MLALVNQDGIRKKDISEYFVKMIQKLGYPTQWAVCTVDAEGQTVYLGIYKSQNKAQTTFNDMVKAEERQNSSSDFVIFRLPKEVD